MTLGCTSTQLLQWYRVQKPVGTVREKEISMKPGSTFIAPSLDDRRLGQMAIHVLISLSPPPI